MRIKGASKKARRRIWHAYFGNAGKTAALQVHVPQYLNATKMGIVDDTTSFHYALKTRFHENCLCQGVFYWVGIV